MGAAPRSAGLATPALELPQSRAGLLRVIWVLAWPVIMTFLFESLVGLVDMLMVNSLGKTAAAAAGVGTQVFSAVSVVMGAVATGTVALVARHIGAEQPRAAERVLQQSLYAVGCLAVLIATPVFVFARELVEFYPLEPEVIEQATKFVRIEMLGVPASAAFFVFASGLRGAGDTRTPLAIGIFVNAVNVALAYTFIFGKFGMPALGVSGAAIAGAGAFYAGSIVGTLLLLRGGTVLRLRRENAGLDLAMIRRILRIGVPTGVEQFLMQIGFLLYVGVAAKYGSAAVAAYYNGVRIMALSFLPGFGFSAAASTLVGQSLGARRPGDAERSGWETNRLAVAFMSAAGIVLFLGAGPISRGFSSDPEVVRHMVVFIRALALAQPLMAVDFTLGGALRGAGDTRFPLWSVILGFYGARLGWAVAAAFVLHLSVNWIWFALFGDYVVRAVMKGGRFRSGKWQRIRV